MTGLQPRALRRSRLHTAGRLAALLVALLGLFAMHGLADHGSTGHGSMPGMTSQPVTPVAVVDDHAVDHVADSGRADSASPAVSSQSGDGHGEMGLLGLCLAIVGALLVFGAGVLLRWSRRLAASLCPAFRQLAAWARARDPAPPDLTLLCIQRC